MTTTFHEEMHDIEEEKLEDLEYDFENVPQVTDDNTLNIDLNRHIEQILDSITRIGGEVCRLRAEVDGLLDQNSGLTDAFHRLKDVLDEKGILDIDDFQLACDVFEESNNKFSRPTNFFKKVTH